MAIINAFVTGIEKPINCFIIQINVPFVRGPYSFTSSSNELIKGLQNSTLNENCQRTFFYRKLENLSTLKPFTKYSFNLTKIDFLE
jgi:hypothetical protein